MFHEVAERLSAIHKKMKDPTYPFNGTHFAPSAIPIPSQYLFGKHQLRDAYLEIEPNTNRGFDHIYRVSGHFQDNARWREQSSHFTYDSTNRFWIHLLYEVLNDGEYHRYPCEDHTTPSGLPCERLIFKSDRVIGMGTRFRFMCQSHKPYFRLVPTKACQCIIEYQPKDDNKYGYARIATFFPFDDEETESLSTKDLKCFKERPAYLEQPWFQNT